jgi:sulfate adenylyltransferase
MVNIQINKNQFSDLLNLLNGVFFPLKHFVNENDFKNILYKKKISGNFFPIPIFFGVTKKNFYKINNLNYVKLFYKKKYLALIKIKSIFKIKPYIFGKKFFGKNYKKHPYYKKFKKENFAFVDFEYKELIEKNLKDKNFFSPENLKKKIKKRIGKNKFLAGFHTRNVPHKAHQWAHNFMISKYNKLLIQPLIGQYKKNEYSDETIIKTNKILEKTYKKNSTFFVPYFSYPRYGGPSEAALHAIVRKNYGCTHFWVGRDHAGYKNFYSKYSSQKFCLKNQKKLGITIIAEKEPYYCSGCKKIVNKKCLKKICIKSVKQSVSGTKIRNIIKKNKIIPQHLMDKRVSKILNKKSILTN